MTTPPAPGALRARAAAADGAPAPATEAAAPAALPRRRMNLLPRLASSAVLILLVAGMIWVGGVPLDVLIGAGAALGAWELVSLLARCPVPAPRWLVVALAVWLAERAVLPGPAGNLDVILPVALGAGVVAGVLLRAPWEGWAAGLGGGLYLGVGLGSLLGLYHWPGAAPGVGLRLLAIVVGAVVATDSLAYFTGHALGRHRFFPSISPRKSVEGAVGGAVGAMLVAGIAGPLVIALNPFAAVGMGLLIAVAAEGGDLAESALKRQAGVKDSGRLIPGHGGLLDRLDGLLLAGPAVYCLLVLIAFR
ncbi:MAG: phosphatidate cytidylyltransferase [Candidatus Dormibacteria bacterium]|jgi:phosphatidate cytidylyltransferase